MEIKEIEKCTSILYVTENKKQKKKKLRTTLASTRRQIVWQIMEIE